jgi:hypothetical protein
LQAEALKIFAEHDELCREQKLKKMEKSPISREDYDLILKHAQDGSLLSVSLHPWHKGCDRDELGEGDLSDVGYAVESWYYDELGRELCSHPHTSLNIAPRIERAGLVLECDLSNEETSEEWDESQLNELVHGLLPQKNQSTIESGNLFVQVDINTSNGKVNFPRIDGQGGRSTTRKDRGHA